MTTDSARTAITRDSFSRSVRHLLDRGLLTEDDTFFDYGCGRGDDVAGLTALGFSAAGWDPNHRPDADRSEADIVNLGYVLNVIPDTDERREALQNAHDLARGCLSVTVLTTYDQTGSNLRPHGDGFITSRSTFQKYFAEGELATYVDATLGVQCLPVTPGHIIVFKDAKLEQHYLDFEPERSSALLKQALQHPERQSKLQVEFDRFNSDNPEAATAIGDHLLRHGTIPTQSEVPELTELRNYTLSARDFCSLMIESIGSERWSKQIEQIQTRLLRNLALAHFRRKPRSTDFQSTTKRAIRTHFGSFKEASDKAHAALFQVGDPDTIEALCLQYPHGRQDEQALYVTQDLRHELPLVLQLYIELGRLFYGELDDVDEFKIHKRSGKLTLLFYDDVTDVAETRLQTRIKINYRNRKMQVFDHSQ